MSYTLTQLIRALSSPSNLLISILFAFAVQKLNPFVLAFHSLLVGAI